MQILGFIKKHLEGRGFFASLMAISTWSYMAILTAALIYQLFLYIFKVKYYNPEINKSNSKERNNDKNEDE